MTKDPVCGMLVAPATAPSLEHEGRRHFFCCTGCLDAFGRDPQRYLGALPQEPAAPTQPLKPAAPSPATVQNLAGADGAWTCPMHSQIVTSAPGACPICGM